MRNLSVSRHIGLNIPESNAFSQFTVDVATGDILGYSEKTVYKLSAKSGEIECFLSLEELGHLTTCYDIVGMNVNSVSEEVCLVLASGDILTVESYSKEVECVGSVDSGVSAVQWSPDEEMIVLVTGKESIITMTGSFDPVNEVDFHDDSFGEKQFITVGWGKKETQFHGSEGKAAARAEEKPVVPSEGDDRVPRVSWRGDGSLYCVSLLHRNNFRQIKVFNREGVLQYTSEYVPGLEMSLAWRPSGNLIASTQTLPNKHQVTFFEKNGLRHGEFSLPFAPQEVYIPWLSWNCDSDVLAVLCKKKNSSQSFLQLWTSNNYHWYLKQNLLFDDSELNLKVQWDIEISLRLHVCQGSRYMRYDLSWETDYSSIYGSDADVAVIDGEKLLLTSFRNSVIPPPMCGETLTLPAAISTVIFSSSTLHKLCVIMCNGDLAIFGREEVKNEHVLISMGQLLWECENSGIKHCLNMHHWLWLTDEVLLSTVSVGRTSVLINISLLADGSIVTRKTLNIPGSIVSLTKLCTSSAALIQLSDGQMLKYLPSENKTEQFGRAMPEPCTVMLTCTVGDTECALGLTNRGNLYVTSEADRDPALVSSGITSVFVLPKFLLMVTSQHTLCCVKLENFDCLLHAQHEKGGRRVERGSRIVVAVDTRVVLQMPRGNLETVTPRTLVLDVAARYLNAANYSSAFELFRKQRINLNLLFDHDPERFLSNIDTFVEDLHNPSWLSLFLSELSSEDVVQTMYAASYSGGSTRKVFDDKVNLVCDKIREAIQKRDDASLYLFPVLTSYVRKNNKDDLACALKEAKASKHISVDEALKYLFYMVDVNEMYNIALGLYDFDLVTLVASKSTKDPKEYLPFLNELRRLEPNYQKYTIDKYLKRYKSALSHISKCPEHFDECLELIKTHRMYSEALQLFNKSNDLYCKVAEAYADYLIAEHKFHDAGIMYERSKKMEKALDAYQRSLDWQEASIVLSQLNYSESQEADFWRNMVKDLVSNRRYTDAACVLKDFLNDAEETVAVLTQGHYWCEAVRISYQSKRPDLLETHVKPGILEHKDHIVHQLNNASKSFTTYKARLAAVREEKIKLKENFGDADEEINVHPENELFSDTSSIAASTLRTSRTDSKASTRSSRSSKNRRKQERKLLSLKEGSKHEDLALVQALHQQITICLNLKDEVGMLCKMLLRFGRDADAAALQHLLDSVLSEMQRSTDEIWSADLLLQPVRSFGPDATTNSIIESFNAGVSSGTNLHLLEPHVRYPPTMTGSQWKLQILENNA
ncbi:elongator complex protein 1 isoform X1 [Schistocerca cancellata]|uniref:elongator complex protein 1 isoform X1 n=1 Tax=Schistocerca cancellata TaxID=274614 RepID=UPI002119439A|nr:elongator complex protein 1 isoform X1 [Schistocerca cancellata]